MNPDDVKDVDSTPPRGDAGVSASRKRKKYVLISPVFDGMAADRVEKTLHEVIDKIMAWSNGEFPVLCLPQGFDLKEFDAD